MGRDQVRTGRERLYLRGAFKDREIEHSEGQRKGSPDGRNPHAFCSGQCSCHRAANVEYVEEIVNSFGSCAWHKNDVSFHHQPIQHSSRNGKAQMNEKDLLKLTVRL